MQARTQRWFRARTTTAADHPLPELIERKGQTTVSVVLPARNEAATVGTIVRSVHRHLVLPGLVDEILVVDSYSSDATASVAAAAGDRVVAQAEVLPELGNRPGKGEALWKALALTSGDLVVYLDADLEQFDPTYVSGLLGPLLRDPSVQFVKAMYDRPLAAGGTVLPTGGGRVTELVARPLLNQFWPELAGFVQPLAGEYAGRRAALERVPFAAGYGVELGMLIDLLERVGLDALAQVDLGRRIHRHQPDEALAAMAMQIQLTAFRRLERQGRLVSAAPPGTELVRYDRVDGRFVPQPDRIDVAERPPLAEVAALIRPRAASVRDVA